VNVEEEYHEAGPSPARAETRPGGGTGRDAPVLPREAIEAAAAKRRAEGGAP
jgi:hypothetical protein